MSFYTVAQVPGVATAALHERERWKSRVKDRFQQQVEGPSFEAGVIKALLSYPEFTKFLEFKVEQLVAESLAPKPTPGSLVYNTLDKKMNFLRDYRNQFVVIDVEKRELIASGKTLEEAMDNARAKTDSMNLYVKHVGHDYLFRA